MVQGLNIVRDPSLSVQGLHRRHIGSLSHSCGMLQLRISDEDSCDLFYSSHVLTPRMGYVICRNGEGTINHMSVLGFSDDTILTGPDDHLTWRVKGLSDIQAIAVITHLTCLQASYSPQIY